MAPRTKKERIFRHMAREVPDYKIVHLDRYELDDKLGYALFSKDEPFERAPFAKKYLGHWLRLAKIRHGEDANIEIWGDYDIDFNRYRLGGAVRSKRYTREKNRLLTAR